MRASSPRTRCATAAEIAAAAGEVIVVARRRAVVIVVGVATRVCEPATVGNGSTIGFACSSSAQADAWHAAGVANGGKTCEDPPGVRDGAAGKLYLAYLRDPDGNKLCGLYRM